jgi:DNA repair protein RecO (recombination protein O)
MPLFETESLVLKSYNLSEADRIVLFFTRDHGMVRGVAKGAKRLNSRFGSTLEPFSTVNLHYFHKEDRELVSVQQVELLKSCFDIASQPAFLQTFSYIADLLSAFVPPHDPNETLYRMVKACLESANDSPQTLAAIRLYFELWLLRLGGFLPDWKNCVDCEQPLSSTTSSDLTASFHILCGSCRKSRGGQTVSPAQREIFNSAQRLAPSDFIEYVLEKETDASAVSSILKRIISNVIGREVASEKSFAVNF